MADFDSEVMWATAGTGEDFQCVHVDFAREQQAEIERLQAALDVAAETFAGIGAAAEKSGISELAALCKKYENAARCIYEKSNAKRSAP